MADRPSLLMTTDAVGGVWRYSVDLCRELARARVRTTLVCLGPAATQEQRSELSSVPGLRFVEHSGALEWMDEPWPGVDEAGRLLQALAAELQPSIVHLNGFSHGALTFSARKVVVAHSCVRSWWQAVEGHAAPDRYRHYARRVARGLGHADAVVAPSRAMLACLERHYGFWGGEVIFNGSRPCDSEAAADAPGKLPFVFCAARLSDRAKNLSVLAEAARRVELPVVVAGKGEVAEPLKALGQLSPSRLGWWMERAAIYALPALYEPFGLSVLEAAKHGAALVLGDIPSLREIWGEAALYVPPRDARALADALNRLARDALLRSSLGRRARRRASRYTLAQQAFRYLELYRELSPHFRSPKETHESRRLLSFAGQ